MFLRMLYYGVSFNNLGFRGSGSVYLPRRAYPKTIVQSTVGNKPVGKGEQY